MVYLWYMVMMPLYDGDSSTTNLWPPNVALSTVTRERVVSDSCGGVCRCSLKWESSRYWNCCSTACCASFRNSDFFDDSLLVELPEHSSAIPIFLDMCLFTL